MICGGCGQTISKRMKAPLCHTCAYENDMRSRRIYWAVRSFFLYHTKHQKRYIYDNVKKRVLPHNVYQNILNVCNGQKISAEKRYKKMEWRNWQNVYMLNEPFLGAHRHHVTEDIAAYIPRKLHNSVYHILHTGRGMKKINKLTMDFLLQPVIPTKPHR